MSFGLNSRQFQIPIIIQARMSSSRLPGKVLMPLRDGTPVLGCMVDRLSRSAEADGLLIATSTEVSDDPIQSYCDQQGILCIRGPLDNVALRFKEVLERFQPKAFVRICGDSPFIDASVVDTAIRIFNDSGADLVTNTLRRTFPKGLSVQVMRSTTFLREYDALTDALDREHVLSFFQNHPERFTVLGFEHTQDFSTINLCIDEPGDAVALTQVAALIPGGLKDCEWLKVVALRQSLATGLTPQT